MRYLWCLVLTGVALGQAPLSSVTTLTDLSSFYCWGMACAQVRPVPVLLAQLPDRIPEPDIGIDGDFGQSRWRNEWVSPSLLWTQQDDSHICTGSCMTNLHPQKVVVPILTEPMDVPAIQETHTEEYGNYSWCNSCEGGSCTAMACNPHATYKVTKWTCPPPKDRVLLTSEDGKKHCIKF